jgi:GNAT superfamily N-acetyltransferase
MVEREMPVANRAAINADIRLAVLADVPALADAMAAAFFDDPVMAWLLADARRRHARLQRFFALELRLVGLDQGCAWTTGRRNAAVLATPPGHWRLPWRVALRHGPDFIRAFGARLPLATALLQSLEHRHIREPHYYYPYIGVAPESQGAGLGTELMRCALAEPDRLGLPAYLEATSPRNAALYERLGFVLRDELSFAGSPPILLMRRPAR